MDVPSGIATKMTTDFGAVAARIAALGQGSVVIDGCSGAGKTTLMRDLAGRLRCEAVDLDGYLERNQGVFSDAVRLPELGARLDVVGQKSMIVVMAGVCAREILERLGRSAALFIYVQRNTLRDIPCDPNALEAEEGDSCGVAQEIESSNSPGALDREVREYHRRFRPPRSADLVYVWTER